jgi:Ca2+-binding EF-hand superfamily protein
LEVSVERAVLNMTCTPQKAKEALTKAFHEIDVDHNGTISAQEIERVLAAYYKHSGKQLDQAKIKREGEMCLKELDKNRDGKIELNEFVNYFMQFCK